MFSIEGGAEEDEGRFEIFGRRKHHLPYRYAVCAMLIYSKEREVLTFSVLMHIHTLPVTNVIAYRKPLPVHLST